jgi:hypothetical protein
MSTTAEARDGGPFGAGHLCWTRTGLDFGPLTLAAPAPCQVCGEGTVRADRVHSGDFDPEWDAVIPVCGRQECQHRFLLDLMTAWQVMRKNRPRKPKTARARRSPREKTGDGDRPCARAREAAVTAAGHGRV